MLTLYLKRKDSESRDILDEVRDMAVAHSVIYVDSDAASYTGEFPFVCDGEREIRGRKRIFEYFEDLRGFLTEWQKFQSDACYCDSEGNVE